MLTLSGNEELSHDALGLCFEFPSPHSPLRINRGEVIGFQSTDLKVFWKIYYFFTVDKFEQQYVLPYSTLYFMNRHKLHFYCFDVFCVNKALYVTPLQYSHTYVETLQGSGNHITPHRQSVMGADQRY